MPAQTIERLPRMRPVPFATKIEELKGGRKFVNAGGGNVTCTGPAPAFKDAKDAYRYPNGVVTYGPALGTPKAREAVAERYPGVEAGQVAIVQGGRNSLDLLFRTWKRHRGVEGTLLLEVPPVWSGTRDIAADWGIESDSIDTDAAGDIDFDDVQATVAAAVADGCQWLIMSLVEPINPLSRARGQKQLGRLVEVVNATVADSDVKVFWLTDGAYEACIEEGIVPGSLFGIVPAENHAHLGTLSKEAAAAGYVAWLVLPDDEKFILAATEAHLRINYRVKQEVQAGLANFLEKGGPFTQELMGTIARRRRILAEALAEVAELLTPYEADSAIYLCLHVAPEVFGRWHGDLYIEQVHDLATAAIFFDDARGFAFYYFGDNGLRINVGQFESDEEVRSFAAWLVELIQGLQVR